MKFVFIRLTGGNKTYTKVAPLERISEIIEEYRLLGWDVTW